MKDQVLVITGATSGIGLATARLAARRGARVVLVGRDRDALDRVVGELDRYATGRRVALGCVADVADADQVMQVMKAAEAAFGQVHTWVNNAGVSVYGRVTDVPLEDQRRLFDVNVWGVVHGCRAAVRHFGARGGVIVNVGSIASDLALPLQGAYSASKHAVRAFSDALRLEVTEAGLPIAVCLVKPSAIDTPFFDHARNYMAFDVEAPPPLYSADVVARAILRCAERPVREITVGGVGRAITLSGALAPRLTDAWMRRLMFRAQQGAPADDLRDGNLDVPAGPHVATGARSRVPLRHSAYTGAALSDLSRALPLVTAAVAMTAAYRLWSSAPAR
ncbi:glucose a-dehydrogenase YxnA [Luteitalea sp. TBR-22]|nr:glucose a-dehydrogenase YxnA [Luteitalea sp. TBR-22]